MQRPILRDRRELVYRTDLSLSRARPRIGCCEKLGCAPSTEFLQEICHMFCAECDGATLPCLPKFLAEKCSEIIPPIIDSNEEIMAPSTIVANGPHLFSVIPQCLIKKIDGPERPQLIAFLHQ